MIHLMDLMKKKCNLMENLIKSITIIQDIIYAFPLKKNGKTTTPSIPVWSPTTVLTEPARA